MLEKDNDLAVLEVSNQVLAEAGYKERFSEQDNRDYYGFKWYQYFERLLPDLSHNEHMALQAACFKFSEANLHILARYIKPNDHALEVIIAIHDAGHDQIILSNTRPHDLLRFVKTVKIEKNFPASKIFGVNAHEKLGTKSDALKQYVRDKHRGDIIIIGDSVADMALARAVGGTTYFYNHPHLKQDRTIRADHFISDLREVLNEV